MENQKYLKDKKFSVILFVFLFLLYSIIYMTKNMFTSATAFIVEEGFLSKSQIGIINAAFWFVYAAFQIIGGFAVDKYSPHKLIMIGLAGALISNTVIYFNQSYYVMMAAWVFNAIAQFGVWPGIFKIVSTQIAPEMRERAAFWLLFSTSAGIGISMLVASFVTDWRNNFLISAISLLLFFILYLVLNAFLDKKMVETEAESQKSIKNTEIKKSPMIPLMLSSGLIVFLFVCLLRYAIDSGIKMMTPVMLMESYENLPAAISTRMSSVLIVFSAMGLLVARFVQRKITRNEARAQIILYAISLLPLLMVCFLGKIHYIWILIALSVAIMMLQGASPFSQTFLTLHFGKYGRIGTVSGILNAVASVGNILASYVFAKMSEIMSWNGVLITWIICIFICWVLCVVVLTRWTRFVKKSM